MIHIDRTRQPPICIGKSTGSSSSRPTKSKPSKTRRPAHGAPVFTVNGRYTRRGWTEWTEGFQYGSALLQFDATGDRAFLELGRDAR